ncbi:MAG: DsbA family protein [Acidobacteriota bacterium]|nr:DsbA family protein [Acidobacteriota bacterium]
MNNENKNNSNLPLIIIGAVLLAAIVGGWYFYQNSKPASNKNTATNVSKKDDSNALKTYQNAPPGAQPPNMLGSPNAQVTVEEFADFQCPTCAQVHGKMSEINAVYGNRIKFIFRSFPLQMHKYGYDAAVAAEAAGMQDKNKYWDMQTQLFTNQTAWANSDNARKMFEDYAQKIGLDVEKFQNDMLGLMTKNRVNADMERGRALNVNGTPTIYVNGKQYIFQQQFEVSELRQMIDAELQKTQGSQPNSQTQTNSANISAANADVSATNTNAVKK